MSDVYQNESNPDDEPGERMQEALRGANAGRDRRETEQVVDNDRRRGDRRTQPR
jgi:hypothetical protein